MVPWSFELGSWQCGAPHPEVAATPQVVLLRLPLFPLNLPTVFCFTQQWRLLQCSMQQQGQCKATVMFAWSCTLP